MKRFIFAAIICVLSTSIFALGGEIVYLEGTVDIRKAGGQLEWAEIGMDIQQGDSIVTGVDGYCEISLEGQSSIQIAEDTVFAFQQAVSSPEAEPENVFRVVMGQIRFKFNMLTGREPAISTPTSTCGIRGTEFTVIASPDGQSLYVVTDGEVAVTSGADEVALTREEGVEVSSSGLSAKFPVLTGNLDYSDWRNQARARALEDPAGTLADLTLILQDHLNQAEYYYQLYLEYKAEVDAAAVEIKALREEGKDEEAQKRVDEYFIPQKRVMLGLILNYRYYAISVLSLRQFSVSTLYVQQRTLHWGEPMPEDFIGELDRFMSIYEERNIPFLDPQDI